VLAGLGVLSIFGSIGRGFEAHDARAFLSSLLSCLALLGSPAVAMLLIGKERQADGRRMTVYQDLVMRQSYRSIDNIAARLEGADAGVVAGDLQRAIQAGLLPGFQLDLANRILSEPASGGAKRPSAAAGIRHAFLCGTCGAQNEVMALPGAVACEYCGAAWVPNAAEVGAPALASPPPAPPPSAPLPAPAPQKSERQIIQEKLSRFSEFRRGCECSCGYTGMMGIEKEINHVGARVLGGVINGMFGGSGLSRAMTRHARFQSNQIQVHCPACDKAWVY